MRKEIIFVLCSLSFLLILGSFYSKYYIGFAIAILIYALYYLWNREINKPDRGYYIVGGIILIPLLIHFIYLWSNLVIIKNVENIIHISAKGIVGAIGGMIYIGALYVSGFVLGEIVNNIRHIQIKKIKIDKALILVSMVFTIASIIVISLKTNYHGDEIMSYGLANHKDGIEMAFETGVTYKPSKDSFLEYMTVNKEYRFDYKIPYSNQIHDVHPPFYYYILHTISSVFPGTFSKWYAGAINIVFILLAIRVFGELVSVFIKDDKNNKFILIMAFPLSAGVLNAIAFFRMYCMAMFWGLLITLIILNYSRFNYKAA